MLSWIIQMIILSVIFIFLVHQLIIFFKENLTVPKIKDLVNAPSQKYENIYQIISSDKNDNLNTNKLTNEQLIPKPDIESMKNELKGFFKEQLHSKYSLNSENIFSTHISNLDTFSNNNYLSSF